LLVVNDNPLCYPALVSKEMECRSSGSARYPHPSDKRIFCARSIEINGGEGDGYNTRKGKKSTRRTTSFEPPRRLVGAFRE